jgi:hypothetical protein
MTPTPAIWNVECPSSLRLIRQPESASRSKNHHTQSAQYYPFGFVAGCIWGDDSSWKIQFLDLCEAEKGILKRDERFGYIALPDSMTLQQAVDLADFETDSEAGWANHITIAIQKRFDLKTGKPIDELS